MTARTALLTLFILLLISSTVSAAQAERLINSSEPGFLQDLGPQDERADNPLAAAVVAVAVGFVILRGLHRYGPSTSTA